MSKNSNANIPFYSKNSNTTISSLFEARKFYNESTIPYITGSYIEEVLIYSNSNLTPNNLPMCDLYGKDALYGYIDDDGDVIEPIENNNNFKQISNNYTVQNFVADAYNDMKLYLNNQAIIGCLDRGSVFYNFPVEEAYYSFNNIYEGYKSIVAKKFKDYSIRDSKINQTIKNHKDFNKEFLKFLKAHMIVGPVTKSRLAVFFNLKRYCNGIGIRLSDSDPGDDTRKYIDYYLDSGFFIFGDACRRYGFLIDKNNPFVITADLNSPGLQPYMKKYGLSSKKDIFSKRYRKVYLEDLQSLKMFFYDSYNIFLIDNFISYQNLDTATNSQEAAQYTTRNAVDIKTYFKDFPDTYWTRLYIYFKNFEYNTNFNQQQFENLTREANNYIVRGNIKSALDYINSRFNEYVNVYYYSTLQQQPEVVTRTTSPPWASKNTGTDIIF